ncbi:crotonase/enoyl-CoA hydratase family protein [Bosea sp. NPDC055594]
MTGKVLVEAADGLMVITINRPEMRNAYDREVSLAVCAAVDRFDADAALRVAILTGAGGNFCAGMDLKAFLRGERPTIEGRGSLGITLSPPKKPLIAAVEGYALAGGFEVMLACDLAVAARNAQFGLPEVKRGLAAAAGGLLRLPRLVPPRIALEIALTGEMISAERAEHFGLVNALVDPGQALAEARLLAARIIANAPLSVAATKRVIVEQIDWSLEERFDRQREITQPVIESSDAREGAAAFAEKRRPDWRGM